NLREKDRRYDRFERRAASHHADLDENTRHGAKDACANTACDGLGDAQGLQERHRRKHNGRAAESLHWKGRTPETTQRRQSRRTSLLGFAGIHSKATAVRLAMEFTILTAVRTSEALFAEWAEFDIGGKLWRIPAERMKMDEPHQVPLSDRCVEILRE